MMRYSSNKVVIEFILSVTLLLFVSDKLVDQISSLGCSGLIFVPSFSHNLLKAIEKEFGRHDALIVHVLDH